MPQLTHTIHIHTSVYECFREYLLFLFWVLCIKVRYWFRDSSDQNDRCSRRFRFSFFPRPVNVNKFMVRCKEPHINTVQVLHILIGYTKIQPIQSKVSWNWELQHVLPYFFWGLSSFIYNFDCFLFLLFVSVFFLMHCSGLTNVTLYRCLKCWTHLKNHILNNFLCNYMLLCSNKA